MEKINLRNFAVSTFLLLFVATNVSGIDFPLKRDDLGPGSVGLGIAPRSASAARAASSSMSRAVEVIPVSMSVEANELGVFFNYAVGGAYISVEDANGSIVISTVVNTTKDLEFYFPLDELEGGTYTLRVQYGSTKLIGDFNL